MSDIPLTRVNLAPLQEPGKDEIVSRYEIAGPRAERDSTLYLDRATLRRMLDVAEASQTGRVALACPGIIVTTYRRGNGWQYEVCDSSRASRARSRRS